MAFHRGKQLRLARAGHQRDRQVEREQLEHEAVRRAIGIDLGEQPFGIALVVLTRARRGLALQQLAVLRGQAPDQPVAGATASSSSAVKHGSSSSPCPKAGLVREKPLRPIVSRFANRAIASLALAGQDEGRTAESQSVMGR